MRLTAGRGSGRPGGWGRLGLGLAAAAALGGAFALGYRLDSPRPSAAARVTRLEPLRAEVLDELRASWYRRVPASAAHARSVVQMVAALHDPYSEYLSPRAYRDLRRVEAPDYSGVGVALDQARAGLRVRASLAGFPASRAGILPGDIITSIDGTSLASLPFSRALDLLRGRAGSRIELRLLRPGKAAPLRVTLVRRAIALPALATRTLRFHGRRLTYVRLIGFPAQTSERMRRLVERCERQGSRGMVLDLRGNPGGLLSEAVDVARLFLNRGVIVSTRGLHEHVRVFRGSGDALPRLPMVVLIDGGTASAAEVLAGALQQAGRAVVVGSRSYGKGTVQAVEPLSNGGALKVTVARFRLRGGVRVNGRGIVPSVVSYDRPDTGLDETLLAGLRVLAPQ